MDGHASCSDRACAAEVSPFTTKEADVGVAVEHQRVDAGRFEGQQWGEGARSRVNVGRLERMISMVAGGALAAYGLKRKSTPGGAAALAAAALLHRGATGHCHLYDALGVNRADG